MKKFDKMTGLMGVLDVSNVDTDQIVPQRFLKTTRRSGFGDCLFYHWRYLADGTLNPDFVLNQPRYEGASILLTGENFGGGSSREHAPWALWDYGFRVLIAPGFADIFKNNCLMIGLLTVELEPMIISEWFGRVEKQPGYRITVDLERQRLDGVDGFGCEFDVDPHAKRRLLTGVDDIDFTIESEAAISRYESDRHEPWQSMVAGPAPAWRKAV